MRDLVKGLAVMTVAQARRIMSVARRLGVHPLTVALLAGFASIDYRPSEQEARMLSSGRQPRVRPVVPMWREPGGRGWE